MKSDAKSGSGIYQIRIFSEDHKAKIGSKRKGCKHSDVTKELMRQKALERKAI